mgnify:CR=1 FL=1
MAHAHKPAIGLQAHGSAQRALIKRKFNMADPSFCTRQPGPAHVIHKRCDCAHRTLPGSAAGRPVLAVVLGSGLGDVCVVVTRYFGGTKLGTGGLVRAYSEAARRVLADVPTTVHESRMTVEVRLDYARYEAVQRLLPAHRAAAGPSQRPKPMILEIPRPAF